MTRQLQTVTHDAQTAQAKHINVLAIGNADDWVSQQREMPDPSQVAFAEFHEIDSDLLVDLGPRIVMSPLLTRSFDCIDLAQLLHKLGYTGGYRALAHNLPKPGIIIREIKLLCPGLDFDIVQMIDSPRN